MTRRSFLQDEITPELRHPKKRCNFDAQTVHELEADIQDPVFLPPVSEIAIIVNLHCSRRELEHRALVEAGADHAAAYHHRKKHAPSACAEGAIPLPQVAFLQIGIVGLTRD